MLSVNKKNYTKITCETNQFSLFTKIVITAFIAFIFAGIICTIIDGIHGGKWPTKLPELFDILKNGFTGVWTGIELLFALLTGVAALIFHLIKHHDRQWEIMLNTRSIVIHPEQQYFDPTHLRLAQHIVMPDDEGGPESHILCIDSSSPTEWWTNDMLGYLAIQARWVQNQESNARSISRIFIWSRPQFLSQSGSKIIELHQLYGYNTYVLDKPTYLSIKKKVIVKDLRRDFLVWDDINAKPSLPEEFDGFETYGYNSYWYVKDNAITREQLIVRLREAKKTYLFEPVGKSRAEDYRKVFRLLQNNKNTHKINSYNVETIRENLNAFFKN